uniref:Uncharacterized protein n=1 Tax=Romanomermis culicivorax TaxID=13658 RepID=A0A915KGI5_ROMCU
MEQMIHICKICRFYTVCGVASVMAASNFIGFLNKGVIVGHCGQFMNPERRGFLQILQTIL